MDWNFDEVEKFIGYLRDNDLTELEYCVGEKRLVLKREKPLLHDKIYASQYDRESYIQESLRDQRTKDFRSITDIKAVQDEIETNRELDKKKAQKEKVVSIASSSQGERDICIKAPLAGIFYRQSKPGEAPYVEAGEYVRKGETIGLMEAMKMITEIVAPCDGVISEFLVDNEKYAEYDSVLAMITEA